MKKIPLGKYKHYKGGDVEVLGVARHSENLEEVVVYSHSKGKSKGMWVRPLSMFKEKVIVEGKMVPRFQLLKKKGKK